ncbi:tubulin polyglutamylase TTLL4-like [Sipha flava]|uniref:Tubulin polyglutamylase TTLL4-like n=1 Tax=Sipha flava TaxID=143950 RepID=A0A8B8G506_9HEMI|nr:tubulin polyglutamylase TTLL4-like [Sipha flava]
MNISNNASVFPVKLWNNHILNSSVPLTSENTQKTHSVNVHQKIDLSSEKLLKLNPYPILSTDQSLKNLNISNKLSKSPHSIDTQKILGANLHQKVDLSSERLLKLAPYPILGVDSSLKNLNFSNQLSKSHHSIGNHEQKNISEQHSGLRLSLFSNMPPYIRFSSHDVKGESFPIDLQILLKWELSSITPYIVRQIIQNSGLKLVRKTIDYFGTWGKHMKSLYFKNLRDQQKFNHIPGTFEIGRKDRLWKNLYRLMSIYGNDQFGFIPTSYILPRDVNILREVWKENDEDKWIVKPPASARGTGIHVISKWSQIPKKVPLVVQRYIDNPYLINDTKFDLRLYILITSINPLRIYLYDNGLVRFASVKYSSDLTTISDRYMHLTNYSINRLSSQYTENEDPNACQGHKWTLRSLWKYMEREHKIDVKKLWDSLADLVVKTVISGEFPISQMCSSNLGSRYNAYELFGIDVLFDEYLKPWIFEVNISPSLHTSSPLDVTVKGPLIKNLLNMVGYHIPNKMSLITHNTLIEVLGVNSPLCYDKRIYTFNLSAKEKKKQEYFANVKSREEYINTILEDLLPDDVRHLITYEDELNEIGSFQKVFPTTSTFKYHEFFDGPRYYNMLFDAWECKYSEKREEGIAVLEKFCQLQVHLEVSDVNDQQQSKTCDTFQDTQMEVERSDTDKINDHQQAVIRYPIYILAFVEL